MNKHWKGNKTNYAIKHFVRRITKTKLVKVKILVFICDTKVCSLLEEK